MPPRRPGPRAARAVLGVPVAATGLLRSDDGFRLVERGAGDQARPRTRRAPGRCSPLPSSLGRGGVEKQSHVLEAHSSDRLARRWHHDAAAHLPIHCAPRNGRFAPARPSAGSTRRSGRFKSNAKVLEARRRSATPCCSSCSLPRRRTEPKGSAQQHRNLTAAPSTRAPATTTTTPPPQHQAAPPRHPTAAHKTRKSATGPP